MSEQPQATQRVASIEDAGRQANDILAQAFGMAEMPTTLEAGSGAPESAQTVDEEQPPVEEPTDETPEQESEEGETGEQAAAEQEQEREIRTLAELAQALEVEPEFLYGLEFRLKGSGKAMTLGQLKDQIQDQDQFFQERSRFDAERVEFQKQQEQFNQQVNQARQSVLQAPQEVLQAQAEIIAWQKAAQHLEANKDRLEPGELALKKQEIMGGIQGAQSRMQTAMGQLQHQQAQQFQNSMAEEARQLKAKIPEWSDVAKAREGRAAIEAMMSEYGLTPEAFSSITDHRYIVMMRDLAKLKAELSNAKRAITNKTRVPKILRPGAQVDQGTVRKQKLDAQLERAKASKNTWEKAAAVSAILNSG